VNDCSPRLLAALFRLAVRARMKSNGCSFAHARALLVACSNPFLPWKNDHGTLELCCGAQSGPRTRFAVDSDFHVDFVLRSTWKFGFAGYLSNEASLVNLFALERVSPHMAPEHCMDCGAWFVALQKFRCHFQSADTALRSSRFRSL